MLSQQLVGQRDAETAAIKCLKRCGIHHLYRVETLQMLACNSVTCGVFARRGKSYCEKVNEEKDGK